MKRTLIAGLLIPILASAVCRAQDKTVDLQYRYKAGDIDRYKLTIGVDMKMPNVPSGVVPPTNFTMSLVARQKVLGILPDGSARVNVSYSDVKIAMPGMPQKELKKLKKETIPGMSLTMRVARDGRILEISGLDKMMKGAPVPAMNFGNLMGQVGQFGLFPTWPVKIGDAWQQKIPLPFESGDIRIVSQLEAAALPLGKYVSSKINQTFEGHIDFAHLMRAVASSMPSANNAKMPVQAEHFMSEMSGGMDLTGGGVIYFAPDCGKLLKAKADMNAAVEISMPASAIQQGAPQQISMTLGFTLDVAKLN